MDEYDAQGASALQEASPSESTTESTSESTTGVDVTIEPPESAESSTDVNADWNEEDSVVLDVDLRNSNYTATNAEGEVLTITDGLIGGTMPILERWFFGVCNDNTIECAANGRSHGTSCPLFLCSGGILQSTLVRQRGNICLA